MMAGLPLDIMHAIVGALALADRCALAATCRAMRHQSLTWFLDDSFDLPLDDEGTAKRPTPAWLRRHGSSVTIQVRGAGVAGTLRDLAGARVTGIRTPPFPSTIIPASALAAFAHTLTS